MQPRVPPGATFRRAEGLTYAISLCQGATRLHVTCRRQGGDNEVTLHRSLIRLLARISAWRTAAEVGVDPSTLSDLVGCHCAFWSRQRPEQVLTGSPLAELAGPVALRDNVAVRPILQVGPALQPFPHMPRLGELDGAELAAVDFEVHEWDCVVAVARVACCARHVELVRDLVPRLDGRASVEALGAEPDAALLVRALDDLGLLEAYRPAATTDGAPRVTWMGHAAVMVEAAGRRILVDPTLFPRSTPTRLPDVPFDPRQLGEIDAVLITHGDSDHFSPQALIRLPRTTPIVVPRPSRPMPFHVDVRRVLALLGFTEVIEVDEWARVELGALTVVAAPFRGEDWGLPLPNRTYLVSGGGLTAYFAADAVTDPEVCDRLARDWSIDVAFVGVTGAAEAHAMPPGFGYGNFYVRWIPPEKHDEWIQLCNGPREAAELAIRIGARHAFGYAAGGVAFYPLAYSDRGSHAEMARHLEERGGPTRRLDLQLNVPTPIQLTPAPRSPPASRSP
jgi:L-ascorbate metabolism protein UlaG (beta-lactamase superfamily)